MKGVIERERAGGNRGATNAYTNMCDCRGGGYYRRPRIKTRRARTLTSEA